MSSPALQPVHGPAGPLLRQEQGVLEFAAVANMLLDRSADVVAVTLRAADGDAFDRASVVGAATALQAAVASATTATGATSDPTHHAVPVRAGRRARRITEARSALADAVDDLAAVLLLWAGDPDAVATPPTAALRALLDRVAARDAALRRLTGDR
ncbi:MAG: hypothetical protein AB7G37_20535 [Solirubrobacteraceae bacterium]